MSEHAIFIIILVVVGIALVAVVAYYVARFLRGTIKLSLTRTAFNPGETISGQFDLHTKKAIESNRLIVSVIGTQVTRRQEGKQSRTRSHEVYRDEVLIEEAKTYPAGTVVTHKFEIPTPDMKSPEFLNSGLGQAMTAALRLVSQHSTRLKWKVEVRLDAKGIDLATSKSITMNIRQLV